MSTLIWLVNIFAYSLSLKSNDNLLLKSAPDLSELNFILLISSKLTILFYSNNKTYKFLHFNFVNGWIEVIRFSFSLNAFKVSMSKKANPSTDWILFPPKDNISKFVNFIFSIYFIMLLLPDLNNASIYTLD